MRVVRELRTLPGEVAAARARGAVRVRRPDGVLRALPAHRPPRRGPGARRHARHGVGGRRAGVLDPAPPPEDHRGGAVAVGRAHAGHARQAVRRGPAGRRARSATRARDRRVPRRRRRRVLLPGDEHPAAGRAPGHRGDHRARSGRAAAARSPTAAASTPNRLPRSGIRSRPGSTPRIPRTDWQPQAGTVHRSTCHGARPSSAAGQRPGSGWTPASSTARWCRSTTTRCWPRSSRYAPTRAAGRAACSPMRWHAARIHGLRTNRDLLVNVLRHPAFLAGATDTAFFDTPRPGRAVAPRWPTDARSGCRRSRPRSPTPRTTARGCNGVRVGAERLAQPGVRLPGQELPRRRGR